MKPVVIVGSGGRLGRELVNLLGSQATAFEHSSLDVTNLALTQEKLLELSPHTIINCAAITNVDWAEEYPQEVFAVNSIGAKNLAEVAQELDADLIYISTDYVFDGSKGSFYHEEDEPNPLNVYGRSKLAGEYITHHLWEKSYLVRTGLLYGPFGPNYVQEVIEKVLAGKSFPAVTDQIASPTSTTDLAKAIMAISESGEYGLYHAVNSGKASRYELALAIWEQVKALLPQISPPKIEPISLADTGKEAPRPRFTPLCVDRLSQVVGYQMRPWEEPLREYVKYYLQERK